MRGEYWDYQGDCEPQAELPPRARRILCYPAGKPDDTGTTSACAENTKLRDSPTSIPWNYLRVRGEYMRSIVRTSFETELPPRARRILTGLAFQLRLAGTTSACAENTSGLVAHTPASGNYLRVRGEYKTLSAAAWASTELPPRARRIRQSVRSATVIKGTTSACAENTDRGRGACIMKRNYLRVRGEYTAMLRGNRKSRELPPRARRIPSFYIFCKIIYGTTSACAENTDHLSDPIGTRGNYLRVRGEYP